MPPFSEPARQKAIARRQLLLDLLKDGMKLADALESLTISRGMWHNWRKKYPDFKLEADRHIRNHRNPADVTYGSVAQQFIAFRQLYFGNDTPRHHELMIEVLTNAKAESISVILAPPGFAKTTLMVDWLSFRMARDPNFRACVISETSSHAEKVLRQIARRMTDVEQFGPFIARYGPFKPDDRQVMKPWNATNLTHVKATHDEKEGSLEARGLGDQIYGARYEEIWLDDVQSVKTKNLTAQIMEKFSQDIVTRPMDNGRIYFIGTRVAQGDVYEQLMTDHEDGGRLAEQVLRLPAYDHHGESLWPAIWPKERLEKRRANIRSNEIWARVYMQQPSSREDATFTEEMILASLDHHRSTGKHSHEGVTVFGVDPALVGWCVVMTCHLTQDRIEVVDMIRRRNCNSSETIMRIVEEQARRYRPRTGIFELANFQGSLFNDQRLAEIAGREGFWIKPHTTAGKKADPILGVAAMDTTFQRGEISIPWQTTEDRNKFTPLVEELRRWRSDVPTKQLVQDTVMALWFIHRHWMLDVRKSLQVVEAPQFARPSWVKGDRWARTG